MDRNLNRGAEILAFTLGLAIVCYVVAKSFSDYLGVGFGEQRNRKCI
ncbi:hypothetical protein ALP73_200450 [Pseudomonas coronafaciens pv. garcae]|uniref:Uncharacterized protein n=1 Tax=Pseudomonas coronafaciens pv. garcae TaxID=251653 RepID=A0AB37QTV8_9PSED|nr:hypothetical protein ALP79_200040 [Pseudomonas savastanoi pv. fraxini]RMS05335.1 hypothetical protein ALP74_200064 [Pseudomonas coronafaciens pv. garcae]RMS09167.1 hypothetical protein ALP73_200450 [Pseudomonas coronafaciens pv. garcae]